jgi:PAS domain S-box-containing protein
MNLKELHEIVEKAGDAAYALNSAGQVIAWNHGAEALFGLSATDAIGRMCCDLVRGIDDAGVVCGPQCGVQRSLRRHEPVTNYDLEVQTAEGKRWCNISILMVDVGHATRPYSVHVMHSIDVSKRFDQLLQDVVVKATGLSPERARRGIFGRTLTPPPPTRLSRREVEVLRLLAAGVSTKEIALQLRLRPATVNNHVGHVLEKLDVHTRLEAVRRAEEAGII